MLAAGKGWVLPVLAMLAAKWRLRVAARGSGPGAKRRRPCPPLRAAAAGGRRDEGHPDPSTPGLRPGSNKGLDKEANKPEATTTATYRWSCVLALFGFKLPVCNPYKGPYIRSDRPDSVNGWRGGASQGNG